MKRIVAGILVAITLTLIPRLAWAEGFLYLPITRRPVITAAFCGYRTTGGTCHGGTDYDVRDDGDGIIAAAAGTVQIVVDNRPNTRGGAREYGNYVQIIHENGYRTIYGHLKTGSLLVHVGDHVRIGAPLAIGDNSGWSTGSHLHFEVRDASGRKVDPYGEGPRYPNCGTNALWAICPPASPADVDRDGDGFNLLEDCDDGRADVYPGATEHCNGRDDDCDGIADNWAALGTACTSEPMPGCILGGVYVCSPDGTTVVCNAAPRAEICDGIDNNCVGGIDEFCLCQTAHPYPNCICHECDAACASGETCLATGFNPDGSVAHTCVGNGCYGCSETCIDNFCLDTPTEYCAPPAAVFCGTYCPSW